MRQRPITGQIEMGMRVVTADGHELGVVSELTSKDFKVDAPRHRDFWLSRQDIATTDDDTVTLHFDLTEVDRVAVPVDAYHREEAGTPPPLEDVLSQEQLGDQRERMLREMAEGRQRLPHEHPDGPDAPPDTGGTFGEPVEEELARREGSTTDEVIHSARQVDTQEPEGGGGTGARVERRDDTHVPPEPPDSARASGALAPSPPVLPAKATPDVALEEREWLPIAPAAIVVALVLATAALVIAVRSRRRRRRPRLYALLRR
jgi:hypothetical protein